MTGALTFTILSANLADDKLVIFFSFFFPPQKNNPVMSHLIGSTMFTKVGFVLQAVGFHNM